MGSRWRWRALSLRCLKQWVLPGFGDGALQDLQGNRFGLHNAEDYYLRAAANVAFAGEALPEATESELRLTGVDRLQPALDSVLKADERLRVWAICWRAVGVLRLMSRLGVAMKTGPQWKKGLNIWNEEVARHPPCDDGRAL
jgi:tetrathionate reductase subunit A